VVSFHRAPLAFKLRKAGWSPQRACIGQGRVWPVVGGPWPAQRGPVRRSTSEVLRQSSVPSAALDWGSAAHADGATAQPCRGL